MEITSFTVVILIAIAVAIGGVLYVLRSHRKALNERSTRREMLKSVESTPLPRMLQALGIGFGRYFYKEPIGDVSESIRLCETCSSINECRDKIAIPELNPEDIEFCPNKDHLSSHSRAQRIRGTAR